jgi:hypothetical protein
MVLLLDAVDVRETTLLATTESASAVVSKPIVVVVGSLS